VSGAFVATEHPFLYAVSATATEGVGLAEVEHAALAELERVRSDGISEAELDRAKRQLRARLVFENESVTNIAHQIGFFQTVASLDLYTSLPARIRAVTTEDVTNAARTYLVPSNRTIGWFEPLSQRV
jgi:zinc protease